MVREGSDLGVTMVDIDVVSEGGGGEEGKRGKERKGRKGRKGGGGRGVSVGFVWGGRGRVLGVF